MNSGPGVLGAQVPRVRVAPRRSRTDGPDAGWFSSQYGLTPDPWQQLILDDWLARDAAGMWSSTTCGLSVPRQNGKNGVIEMRELFGMVELGEKFLHTAHEVKTARKAFLRIVSFFENKRDWPELAALVAPGGIRRTNGQEALILTNGGSVEFIARSKGSGRGFTVDVQIFDEAQEFSDDHLEALGPTNSSAPTGNPQRIITGTPPTPKTNGEVFARTRGEALGRKSRTCWHEWSCEGTPDLDSPQEWAKANPAIGYRKSLQSIEDDRTAFSDDGFAREHLGMWDDVSTSQVIDAETWRARADSSSRAVDRFALAVDVNPERSMASVALAGVRADGRWHVEIDEHRAGTAWLVPWIAQRCDRNPIRAVVVDGSSPAASIIDELAGRGIVATVTGARDMAAACGSFYSGAFEGSLVHTDQPQMNLALSQARKRPLGDAWGWNRKNSASDITPVVAETLALWGAQSSTAKKPTRSREPRKVVILS